MASKTEKQGVVQTGESAMLKNLLNCTFKIDKEIDGTHTSLSLHIIRGELWSCQPDGISIYNAELELIRKIPTRGKWEIRSAADIGNAVVIGAWKGLFLISYAGEDLKKISDGCFSGVAFHDGHVYANEYNEDYMYSVIHVFSSDTWKRVDVIQSPCDDDYTHSFRLNGTCLAFACSFADIVCTLNLKGSVIKKYDNKDVHVGQFSHPFVHQIDGNNGILVLNRNNSQLLVCHSGKWHKLPIECEYSCSALYTGEAFYLCSNNPTKITKYSLEK